MHMMTYGIYWSIMVGGSTTLNSYYCMDLSPCVHLYVLLCYLYQ